MTDITMIPYWKTLCCVLLLALMGAPGVEAWPEISWPGQVTAGSSKTFTCSSPCNPDCVFTWYFKGRTINGSSFSWTPDGQDNTVELKCNVLNPRTGARSIISIVDIRNPVSVQIFPPNNVPTLNRTLVLLCHRAPPGDFSGPSQLADPVVWYKDGQKMTPHEQKINNVMLHFDSLLPSDAGFYMCEITVHQTRVFSRGYLLSFDAWNVSISGPDIVFPGRLSEFTCLTSCSLNVDCTVRWEFRQGFPIGTYFSVNQNKLKWTPSMPGTFQKFTCVAENAAAGRSAEDTKMVEVKGIPLSGSEALQLSGPFTMMLSLGLLLLSGS
ncbi:hypothetical protein PBY51_017296 [Eleginops maclovinus]|uniref:Ig-like domain-containing protein n=1 Tax=Eleginops maclovinus TaxID=56733 RepID=A0AAN8ANT9_ELEMC|nr:hypothetical protein PBY51_017296 [Eleginops maclovinus]